MFLLQLCSCCYVLQCYSCYCHAKDIRTATQTLPNRTIESEIPLDELMHAQSGQGQR
jgi:hypothetical protein